MHTDSENEVFLPEGCNWEVSAREMSNFSPWLQLKMTTWLKCHSCLLL